MNVDETLTTENVITNDIDMNADMNMDANATMNADVNATDVNASTNNAM